MADHFTSFLDFRPLTAHSNFNPLFLPWRCSASRINGFTRKPLYLTLLAKSSSSSPPPPSNFDVISTHEHSDGSLLFKFGDPTEVAKNLKTEESNTVEEEPETLSKDGNCGVKVSDKYDEAVTIGSKSIEPEEGDETNSAPMITETIDFIQENKGSNEELLESLNYVEIPASIANAEMDVASPDVEEDISNLEKAVGEKQEDASSADAPVVDKGYEEENVVSTVEFLERETDGLATLVSITDKSADSVHKNVDAEIQNKTIKDGVGGPSSELEMNPHQVIEHQNLQLGDGSGSDTNYLIVPEAQDVISVNKNRLDINGTDTRPVSNPTVSEDHVSEIETGFPNKIVNEVKESSKVPLPAVSPQIEVEPLPKETGAHTREKSTEDNGVDILTSNLILGPARTGGDNNVQNGNLVEASADRRTGMKFIESVTMSEDISVPDLTLSSGAALFPHPSKVLAGGEDAYFIVGQTWFGVADGVGCWSLEGTWHGVYAKELTRTCERLVSSVNNVAEFLDISVAETHAPGSSTILVAHFDGQALHVANVGDSGFIILRHGTVYQKSSPMYYAFHFPLHVEQGSDEPSHIAEFYKVDLEEGDVIITATDGLFDNLYGQEIASTVTKSLSAGKKLEEIAEALAKNAQAIGGCAYRRSPFADDAQAAGYCGYTGGKLDDVTVIVSVVRMQSAYESSD